MERAIDPSAGTGAQRGYRSRRGRLAWAGVGFRWARDTMAGTSGPVVDLWRTIGHRRPYRIPLGPKKECLRGLAKTATNAQPQALRTAVATQCKRHGPRWSPGSRRIMGNLDPWNMETWIHIHPPQLRRNPVIRNWESEKASVLSPINTPQKLKHF